MSSLIDTNAWIGFFEGRKDFGADAKKIMIESEGDCFVSVASLWETAIKVGLRKLALPYDLQADLPRLLEDNGFEVLGLTLEDVTATKDLPSIHGDPFDRIQVVQAQRRRLDIVSRDPIFERYGLKRIW